MTRNRSYQALLFGSTIFLSAFLLFSVQPMFAKLILPWFGGSAAVWTTCLVFYQTALLAGYAYSWTLPQTLSPRAQAILHCVLLLVAIAVLFAQQRGQRIGIAPDPGGHPAAQILLMLGAMIGLPYILLSATSPLLQTWYEGSGTYRLFAVSNGGALIALVAYPIWIEPRFPLMLQQRIWSVGFVLFGALCSAIAFTAGKRAGGTARSTSGVPTSLRQRGEWIGLAAAGSMLLLATTNQLTQNIAPVPLLWVLPLAIYLLTFILAFDNPAFDSSRWYRRDLCLRLLAIALASMAYAISDIQLSDALIVSIPLFCGGLFVGCMFCHGELHRLKPDIKDDSSQLTSFYLMIALGGAVGAIFVGVIAPLMFTGVYELPIAMTAVAGFALWMNRDRSWSYRLLWSAVTIAMLVLAVAQVRAYHRNAVDLERSFYGSLRVTDANGVRALYHGTIEHGAQFLSPAERRTPTAYYGEHSGVGIALQSFTAPKRVGVIGLGTGTLATYGRAGDDFHFYEINPQVVGIARRWFSFLSDSAARIEVTLGDARLSLEHETLESESPQGYDVLIVDAFSGDAIPVHLLTKEAFALYLRHLKPEGVLAIHVSNQYLDLTPVVAQLAATYDLPAVEIRSLKDESRQISLAEWILMSRNRDFMSRSEIVTPKGDSHVLPVRASVGRSVWTDDYNNLFQVMRWIPN